MRSRCLSVIAVCFLVSASAYAQDFAGTWAGEAQGRGGTQEVTLKLEVSGDDVSGTFMQGQQSGPIADAEIDDGTLTFSRSIETPQGEFNISYTGTIEGNELTLTPALGGGRGGRGGGGRGGGGRGGGGRGGGPQPITLTLQ